jgi:hypothetical protein
MGDHGAASILAYVAAEPVPQPITDRRRRSADEHPAFGSTIHRLSPPRRSAVTLSSSRTVIRAILSIVPAAFDRPVSAVPQLGRGIRIPCVSLELIIRSRPDDPLQVRDDPPE